MADIQIGFTTQETNGERSSGSFDAGIRGGVSKFALLDLVATHLATSRINTLATSVVTSVRNVSGNGASIPISRAEHARAATRALNTRIKDLEADYEHGQQTAPGSRRLAMTAYDLKAARAALISVKSLSMGIGSSSITVPAGRSAATSSGSKSYMNT